MRNQDGERIKQHTGILQIPDSESIPDIRKQSLDLAEGGAIHESPQHGVVSQEKDLCPYMSIDVKIAER